MPRRRLLPFAAIALVVLAAPAVGLAGSSAVCLVAARQNAQLARAPARPCSSSTRSTSASPRARTRRPAPGRGGLARAERATSPTRSQSPDAATGIAQRQLAARLRADVRAGRVEPLEIFFGSKSLDDALSSSTTSTG